MVRDLPAERSRWIAVGNLERHSARLLMNDAIRGENNGAARLVGLPGEVADFSARLLYKQNAGGGVPGLEPEFPKAVKSSRGDAREILVPPSRRGERRASAK